MKEEAIKQTLYRAGILSGLTVAYSMLLKKILNMAPPSVAKMSLEDVGKLIAIVAASDLTRQWSITREIIPPNI